MKLQELFESKEGQDLEACLLKVYRRLKNMSPTAIGPEGQKFIKMITTKFINLVEDGKGFSKVYSKYHGEKPDAMDFYLEELFGECNVDNVDKFFAKYFPKGH